MYRIKSSQLSVYVTVLDQVNMHNPCSYRALRRIRRLGDFKLQVFRGRRGTVTKLPARSNAQAPRFLKDDCLPHLACVGG